MHQFASSQLVKKQRLDVRFINVDETIESTLLASISSQQKLYSCIAHDFQDGLPLLVKNSIM